MFVCVYVLFVYGFERSTFCVHWAFPRRSLELNHNASPICTMTTVSTESNGRPPYSPKRPKDQTSPHIKIVSKLHFVETTNIPKLWILVGKWLFHTHIPQITQVPLHHLTDHNLPIHKNQRLH